MHGPECQGSTIKAFSDNTTAIKYAMKAGGTASPFLQKLALEIMEITLKYQLRIQ
ncbi:hypothetical protein DFQ28_001549, partial [Apophysomyces sp. BC1034]